MTRVPRQRILFCHSITIHQLEVVFVFFRLGSYFSITVILPKVAVVVPDQICKQQQVSNEVLTILLVFVCFQLEYWQSSYRHLQVTKRAISNTKKT